MEAGLGGAGQSGRAPCPDWPERLPGKGHLTSGGATDVPRGGRDPPEAPPRVSGGLGTRTHGRLTWKLFPSSTNEREGASLKKKKKFSQDVFVIHEQVKKTQGLPKGVRNNVKKEKSPLTSHLVS